MKKISVLALGLLLALCSLAQASKQDVINATGRVVVARPVLDDEGNPVLDEKKETTYEWYSGTAFIFREVDGFTYMLTAGHVVDGAVKGYVEFGSGDNAEKIVIVGIMAHKYTMETVDDVAVLALNTKDFKKAPKPLDLLNPRKQPAVGAKVFIYGFPNSKATQKDAKIMWAQEHAFRTNVDTPPGFSGSPVYNEQMDCVFGLVQLRNSKSGTSHTIYRVLGWRMPPIE